MVKYSREEMVARAREVVTREAEAVLALADQFDESIVSVVELLLSCRGHVLVAGMGTSHAIARRCAHLLSCCGTPALCIDAGDSLHGGSGAITADDVLCIISKGGESEEVNTLADIAHARGAKVIAQTEHPDSTLGRESDAVFRVEALAGIDPYGMIATGSSLVNGAVCDALCVLLLELREYSPQAFHMTHPGGAVGKMDVPDET
ncbi:MAG: SIS domain-containing protein [Anaerolineae bacterium]|nr:SIS domain-containing protein [Anaerolineae bacterium]